jgi:hypothetical protein
MSRDIQTTIRMEIRWSIRSRTMDSKMALDLTRKLTSGKAEEGAVVDSTTTSTKNQAIER